MPHVRPNTQMVFGNPNYGANPSGIQPTSGGGGSSPPPAVELSMDMSDFRNTYILLF